MCARTLMDAGRDYAAEPFAQGANIDTPVV